MERYKPDNPENEPEIRLAVVDGEYLATRENTRLYSHLGKLALYDHVYYNDGGVSFYIFNFVEGYEELATAMVENNYPLHLNQTEVSRTDLEAYDRSIKNIAGKFDHIPDDWV